MGFLMDLKQQYRTHRRYVFPILDPLGALKQ